MATPFLTSDEYDERAHRLYDQGDYDGALRTLQDGLRLYPHSVELYVGLGYTRVAREEFAWAKQAFERAVVLDPENEDALVALAEMLLLFGRGDDALALFRRVRERGYADDAELLVAMGRALYRERLFRDAHEAFRDAAEAQPDQVEALAGLGYTLHRLGDDRGAARALRRALRFDPEHHEARVYLANLHYDRGDRRIALRHLERVPPHEHWDPLAVWRLIELKRRVEARPVHDPALAPWEARLEELERRPDGIDRLLAEVHARAGDGPVPFPAARHRRPVHRIRTSDGTAFSGTWREIVGQFKNAVGRPDETIAEFMRRHALEAGARVGVRIPWHDPEAFLRASAHAGLLFIEY